MTTTVVIPVRTKSGANLREHWRVRAKRVATERGIVRLALLSQASSLEGSGHAKVVRFTRIAPRDLDSDNLASSQKAIRDEIAKFLGVSDAPSGGVTWEYFQQKGRKGEYAVVVEIEP